LEKVLKKVFIKEKLFFQLPLHTTIKLSINSLEKELTSSIYIINVGSLGGSYSGGTWEVGHTSTSWSTSSFLINSHHDGIKDFFKGLVFSIELFSFSILVGF